MSTVTERRIPRTGVVLGWVSILFGALTAFSSLLPVAEHFSTAQLIFFVLLGLTGAIAGIDTLRGSSHAFYVLWYVYAVQMFAYASESLTFSFMAPYSIAFGMGDNDPPSLLSINIPAIGACLVALYNARFLRRAAADQVDSSQ